MGWGEQNHLAMEWASASVSGHEKDFTFWVEEIKVCTLPSHTFKSISLTLRV